MWNNLVWTHFKLALNSQHAERRILSVQRRFTSQMPKEIKHPRRNIWTERHCAPSPAFQLNLPEDQEKLFYFVFWPFRLALARSLLVRSQQTDWSFSTTRVAVIFVTLWTFGLVPLGGVARWASNKGPYPHIHMLKNCVSSWVVYAFERRLCSLQCQSIYGSFQIVRVKEDFCTLQDFLKYGAAMYPLESVRFSTYKCTTQATSYSRPKRDRNVPELKDCNRHFFEKAKLE